MYYFNYCLHGFTTSGLLNEHVPYCSTHGPQKLTFPNSEDKQWILFTSIHKQMKVLFVIYADVASFVKPIDSCAQTQLARPQHDTKSIKHIVTLF
jgi:hypothetical protein